ncbi:nucleoside-triphosphate diphosphatase [Streptococcus plurextorum]|uniref:nucleoside-triphosphate diphosphatase n=1 Tax=Streptococcus plurextorum TaxID=456876 RepID=UPI00040B4B7F|nr:nucleoside-triphosphate diphosphatase [Streptococcus plurextorum]
MTDKIFDYKDDQNWFIGKWESFNYMTCFGDDEAYEEAHRHFQALTEGLNIEGLQVHIARLSSPFHFLNFMIDIVNAVSNRSIALTQHGGALLVSEDDRLLFVHLPQEGVPLADFFGNSGADFGETLLIATKNEGKTKEFRNLFEKMGIRVQNLNDYPELPDVEETGMTFEENARLKAETIAQLTGKMVLADDSGLKVDALGGLPGVWSARFSGPDATDEKNNLKLLHELGMVFEQERRSAQFHCCLVVAHPEKESLVVEAEWPGYIGFEAKGDHGFGYDPLFLVGETGRTSAQLLPEEKNSISHRGQAVKKLMEVFPSWLNTQ